MSTPNNDTATLANAVYRRNMNVKTVITIAQLENELNDLERRILSIEGDINKPSYPHTLKVSKRYLNKSIKKKIKIQTKLNQLKQLN